MFATSNLSIYLCSKWCLGPRNWKDMNFWCHIPYNNWEVLLKKVLRLLYLITNFLSVFINFGLIFHVNGVSFLQLLGIRILVLKTFVILFTVIQMISVVCNLSCLIYVRGICFLNNYFFCFQFSGLLEELSILTFPSTSLFSSTKYSYLPHVVGGFWHVSKVLSPWTVPLIWS